MSRKTSVSAVDIFCGAGGLTHGLLKEGIDVRAGVDIDPACRYPFEKNNDSLFILRDVSSLTGRDILGLYPKESVKLLAGCAPCQPFSLYTQGKDPRSDSKWGLLLAFAKIVESLGPEVITMENVVRIADSSVYHEFASCLEKAGYGISSYSVYCPDYGIPQNRRRFVFFASTYGVVDIIHPTHSKNDYRTVRQTIGHLDPIEAGDMCQSDPLHKASGLSRQNMERIRSSRPGGTWREWREDLISGCHRRKSGRHYSSVYGRMEWDSPSPTITTQCYGFGNGRFGHPEQDRAISLREASLLQTFPEDYSFVEDGKPIHFTTIGRLIGNAVPVELGSVVARSILSHLEKHHVRT